VIITIYLLWRWTIAGENLQKSYKTHKGSVKQAHEREPNRSPGILFSDTGLMENHCSLAATAFRLYIARSPSILPPRLGWRPGK
jgi:hypothetical protein